MNEANVVTANTSRVWRVGKMLIYKDKHYTIKSVEYIENAHAPHVRVYAETIDGDRHTVEGCIDNFDLVD